MIEKGTGKKCRCGGEIMERLEIPYRTMSPGGRNMVGPASRNIATEEDATSDGYHCGVCGIQYYKLPENKPMLYSMFVVIFREGIPEIISFKPGEEEEAEEYFERVSVQWSDSYLCRVLRGPVV